MLTGITQLAQNPDYQRFFTRNPTIGNDQLKSMGLMTPGNLVMNPAPGTMEAGLPYQLGEWMGTGMRNTKMLRPLGSYLSNFGASHGLAALFSALGGGALGAGYGWLTDRSPTLWGGIGAGVGGLGGFGLSKWIESLNKQRYKRYLDAQRGLSKFSYAQSSGNDYYISNGQDPEAYIQSRLFADPSMNPSAKSQMIMQIQQLPREQLVTLADLLRSAMGAGVGYLIGRFLLNLGGVGQGISAGLGGLFGAMMGRGSGLPVNVYGEEVDTRHDPFGRSRFVQ